MNKNKNVMIKRGAGIGLAALMAVSVSGCGVNENSIQASSAEQEKETKEAVITHGAKDNKNEMVYVVAKNDGSAEKTIVTEWLSNPSELKEIIDFSDLKDIENLKGDEGFSVDEDGKLVWKAGGKDIYYRGTANRELPVDVHITYTLDGKEISPDELAGKSGKLTMTFEYTKNIKKEVKIGDEKTDIYMPFAVISGAVFDNEKVSELTVEGGKAVNDGERTLVVGLALPGLSESLGIDRANHDLLGDIDIPEKIVISANVKDFSLMTTLTLVDNSIFKELGLSDGKTDLSGISGLMDQVLGAFEKIVSGSEELAGGAKELDTGAKVIHMGRNTSSHITTKSISRDGGKSNFRSEVKITREAENSKSAVTCESLMLDDQSRSDTIPVSDIRNSKVDIGHEAKIGRISEDSIFYLMSRGLSEDDAKALIVGGFAEPIAKELPVEYAVEMNNLINLEMKGSIG